MRFRGWRTLFLGLVLSAVIGWPVALGQPPAPTESTEPREDDVTAAQVSSTLPPPACPDPAAVLEGPSLSEGLSPVRLNPSGPGECDRALPINLATALRLADARPLVIAAAEASVQVAAAQLEQAKVLWLPTIYLGIDDIRHDGGQQTSTGRLIMSGKNQLMVGGGAVAIFATTDAIFSPLASRQVLKAYLDDVQTARNDALLTVAEAYFNVQRARGQLAGAQDSVAKGQDLLKRVAALGKGLVPPIEADRVRTFLADLEQQAASDRENWQVASTELTRVLRLDPAVLVLPLEPAHLRVTLISPEQPVDGLIPIGLVSRPELAAQQALVQATLLRLKQEKLRPLIPSLILQGNSNPGGRLSGGLFGSASNNETNPWVGRSDVNVQVLWELRNLGFGNRGLVHERQAQQQQALVTLYAVQDQVAAEVAQAHAQLKSANVRVARAEVGLQEALVTYAGNLKGLGETVRFGDLLQPIVRPQEAVAALALLVRAYENYFSTVADYNRAQFRLFRALGYPARLLTCERSPGPILPVDTTRPPQMAPVCSPEPCQCPP